MKKEIDFEKNMQRLQSIADELRGSDISLEKSSALYEEGMKLSNECKKYLDEKELLIKVFDKEKN